MSQLTRLRVMDALVPGVFYTFDDIAAEVEAPEHELRKSISTLCRNKALRYLGNTKPVGYERPIEKPKNSRKATRMINVFGRHDISRHNEALIGEVMRKYERRNGHRKGLPATMDKEELQTKRQQRVLDFIAANPGCRRNQISRGTDISDGYVGNLLAALKRRNEITAKRDLRQGNHTFSRYWVQKGV
ncbi:MAG: helix-turn-helix domain-containing protein [Pseudomonadota bacterium]